MMKKNSLKKPMKHFLWIGVLFVLLSGCSDLGETTSSKVRDHFSDKSKLQGSGKGGIIEIVNLSSSDLYVTWSGVGCAGATEGLTLVCETGKVQPNRSQVYKYNWGVTTTWVNIGSKLEAGGIHPCSPLIKPTFEEECLFDHRKVKTKANLITTCVIGGQVKKSSFRMTCDQPRRKSRQTKRSL